jgi:protein-tyrosine phosphatase
MDRAIGERAGEGIVVASLPNLRDVGGWPTRDGRMVRRGLVYRSVALNHLTDGDLAAVGAFGLRTVYDLRTEAERTAQPDRALDGVEHVVVDVLAGSKDAAPAELIGLLSDPEGAREMLGDGKAEALFTGAYREIVSLPSALAGYRALFTGLADATRRPALYHCTTGKDRTGWATAALLSLLGVEREIVMREYLLTNDQLVPALEPVFERFEAAGGDRAVLLPVLGVVALYLQASFDEMDDRFGTIEGYFADGLSIDIAGQEALRDAFLTRSSDEGGPR